MSSSGGSLPLPRSEREATLSELSLRSWRAPKRWLMDDGLRVTPAPTREDSVDGRVRSWDFFGTESLGDPARTTGDARPVTGSRGPARLPDRMAASREVLTDVSQSFVEGGSPFSLENQP